MKRRFYLLLLCWIAPPALADETEWKQCADIANRNDRLRCYDKLVLGSIPQRSHLTEAWDLDGRGSNYTDGVRRLEPYRKNQMLVIHTSNINKAPRSPAPGHSVVVPYNHQPNEVKFQISAKSEIGNYRNMDLLMFSNFRIWAAYTQQSYWQIFNGPESSPFRETNYEPELIGTFGTGKAEGWKLLNVGFSHQSNGRANPDSRSWNRIYLQGGWEWDDIYVLGRGWWRIPESKLNDDNPDITKYIGRGDLIVHWSPDREDEVMLLARSNLSAVRPRGYLQLDWSTPVRIGHLSRLSLQLATGYGATLIDYNHPQTTFGVGLTFK